MATNEVIEEAVIERKVKPVGNLLNDNDSGVDQLGYHVYAKALARLIHSSTPPLTVGIFGPWGIGKSFLLKHVQGLLRKYEQQQNYDEVKTGKSSSTKHGDGDEVDGKSDDSEPVIKPKNRTRRKNSRRACTVHCIPIVASVLILVLFAGLLVLVAIPFSRSADETLSLEPPISGGNETGSRSRKVPQGRSSPLIPDIGNLTESSSSEPPTGKPVEILLISRSVRFFLLLFLILLTGMMFVIFYFCVKNTNSKSCQQFCNNFKLVFYAAFTRIPSVTASPSSEWIEANKPCMVRHYNDENAELRPFDPGEEENMMGARITSRQVRRMPSQYIFVNYQTWQYVGSDTLWAGIVTTLSEAIEKEFGSVCTRLFRMMQVERPSKSGPINVSMRGKQDPRVIYVRFIFTQYCSLDQMEKRKRVMVIVKEYGVVTECNRYLGSWWYVRFSCDKEAEYAKSDLELIGFEVEPTPPTKDKTDGESTERESRDSVRRDTPEVRQLLVEETSDGNGNNGRSATGNNFAMKDFSGRTRSQANRARSPGDDPPKTSSDRSEHNRDEQKSPSCCASCCLCCTHFRRHPKTVCCGCPFLYFCIIFVVTALMFPVTVMVLAEQIELGVIKSNRPIPIEVQIFSWFPATLGVLFIALRFCWAMCHSQTDRIRKALSGTQGSMGNALGFMNDVKKEVMIMTQLINCVRFTHGIDYKIVITIDDLDRCPREKVKPVLEAISVLLSDRSSPFLCMIAVDSRVAVKCIEQEMGEVLLQAHLTGHEYLKKIINLPFCLAEVSNDRKKKYFGGIIDDADEAIVERSDGAKSDDRPTGSHVFVNGARCEDSIDAIGSITTDSDVTLSAVNRIKVKGATGITQLDGGIRSGHIDHGGRSSPTPQTDEKKLFDNFLFRCREIIHGVGPAGQFIHQHMSGNPRNMKRIFNVMSLTTHLMECLDEERTRHEYLEVLSGGSRRRPAGNHHQRREPVLNSDFRSITHNVDMAEDLVKWIMAVDQWPYRISYILQVIEDSDQRRNAGIDEPEIKSDCKLSDVYETFVEVEIYQDTNACSMLTLDHDPAMLRSFLRGSPSLTRQKVSQLFPVTLNLDQSLRNGISRQRAIAKSTGKEEKQEGTRDDHSVESDSDDSHSAPV